MSPCVRLVQAQSYSGKEAACAKVLASAMEASGFDQTYIDSYGNVVGCIKGNLPGPRILLDGHIDTVPVDQPELWEYPPLEGTIANNRIYGRGTSDMKGAVAAMVCASAFYAKRCNRDFPGEIYVAGVVCEELFEGVASRVISSTVQPNFVVIGEASELDLKIGQRGRAEIVLETIGKSAHSASPTKGINAVKKMIKLISAIDTDYNPPFQNRLGYGIMELTDIISSPFPGASVVPASCFATLDRRLLTTDTPKGVL